MTIDEIDAEVTRLTEEFGNSFREPAERLTRGLEALTDDLKRIDQGLAAAIFAKAERTMDVAIENAMATAFTQLKG